MIGYRIDHNCSDDSHSTMTNKLRQTPDRNGSATLLCLAFNFFVVAFPVIFSLVGSKAKPFLWVTAAESLLLLMVPLIIVKRWGVYFLLILPITFLGMVYQLYLRSYGALPNSDALMLVVNSSLEEVLGTIKVFGWTGVLAFSAGILALYLGGCVVLWKTRVAGFRFINLYAILLVAFVAVVSPVVVAKVQFPSEEITNSMVEQVIWTHPIGALQYLALNLPDALENRGPSIHKSAYGVTSKKNLGEEVYVLVVGEAARYDTFHINGYASPTSPELEEIGVVSMPHVLTTSNLTMYAVPMLMTGLAPASYREDAIHGSILDLFKEAGYSTAWLVNQDINVGRIFGPNPDFFYYPLDGKQTVFGRSLPDGVLLPKLAAVLRGSGKAQFIGLHTSGSHWEYENRYPDEFDTRNSKAQAKQRAAQSLMTRNTEAMVRPAYEDSIRYTDHVVAQVIYQVAATHKKAIVVYVPDHGENFFSSDVAAGHGSPSMSKGELHIPAFIWASQEYQTQEPEKWKTLLANAKRPFTSDGVFHTIADMAGLDFPELDKTRSLGSERYTPRETVTIKTIAGLKDLSDCRNCEDMLKAGR